MHEGLLYSTHSLHHLSFFPYYMNTMKKKKKQGHVNSKAEQTPKVWDLARSIEGHFVSQPHVKWMKKVL